MKVKDVMNSNVIYCKPDDRISDVAQLLRKNEISGMPVVESEKLIGLISELDLLQLLEIPKHGTYWLPSPFEVIEIPIRELISWEEAKRMLTNIGTKPVKEIMRTKIYTVSPEDSIEEASTIMIKNKINRLPVVSEGKLVGIVTRGDIIKGLADV
ncbi:putative signal transduction protein with CBS domains [Methanosalsum zhilinae DSM 4017]|uniref:Putative signal transduction protein with CBS domains n=1 Tax=Methanosalsum zhilinae (strain DSM 4017 / NBRC 107636 / OCM 62 / WeN5) TaxID=679901 RepID=F7XKY6_METZD|nr:CBS domain-containing protein [Methanosalsum zhilinae]AEH60684.1 putative signal transduction protein with CBS domains [Methanosalsum zhilinae DSM 4017]